MFERFTERARRVIILAQEEAKGLNHGAVEPEHILLGIIREGEGVASKVLESLNISPERIRAEIESSIGRGERGPYEEVAFTQRAKKVLELALDEARRLGHNYIGTEHQLLGLIREGKGAAARVLEAMGTDLERVRQRVIYMLGEEHLHARPATISRQVQTAASFVRTRTKINPHIAIVLGSGLGALAGEIAADATIPYGDIPSFPRSTVEGHAGQLILGQLEGKPVVAMAGRVHFYEGYTLAEVVFPVRVMRALGADVLLVSNAAGGINPQWQAGDLMLITDHINFMGANSLMGPNDPTLGPRFPDMSAAYDRPLAELAERAAHAEGLTIRKGVYVAVSGPSFETPAELRMLGRWGADAVGMSTVPEVIAARHMGMRVLGITAITDMATGEQVAPVTHEEVLAVAKRIEPKFIRLVKRVVKEMPG